MNKEIMRIVKGKSSPTLSNDSDGWLVRNTCMLHLYLMHVKDREKPWACADILT